MAESEEEVIGACATNPPTVTSAAGYYNRTTLLNQVAGKLSANIPANKRRSSASTAQESKDGVKTLRIGADRGKAETLRKGKKRRTMDRSQNNTVVSSQSRI